MSPILEQGLIILVFTAIVVLIVLAVFIVRVLINASILAENINKTTDMLNNELEPTIKELNQVLSHVNKFADSADTQMTNAHKLISKVMGVTGIAMSGLKSFSGSFLKGFISAAKLFIKKK
ncbi:DUF948 domain-containing protein [bacterium]|nr:DUF948 domain-containing protein [bacterium]